MNPLFNALNGNPMQNMMSQLNQLRNNPVHFLMQRRYNIPENLSGNPQGIVQHLLDTGQMSQATYNRLQTQANQIMRNMK